MKKIMSLLLIIIAAFSLISCGRSDRQESSKDSKQTKGQTEKQTVEESETSGRESKQAEQNGGKKILVPIGFVK